MYKVKKVMSIFLFGLIVCAFTVCLQATTIVKADAPAIEAAYLMDEDFNYLSYLMPGEAQSSG